MKKLIYLFLAITLLACGRDDESTPTTNTMDVTVGYITNHEAGINWTTPTLSLEGTVSYKIVLEGEVIAENYKDNHWDFTQLFSDYEYSGSIFAVDTSGNSTFSDFSFRTEITPFNTDCYNCFITLRTQTEVDNFPPYTSVNELTIAATNTGDDITNLDGLSTIKSINQFWIHQATISNVDGLENLIDVGICWIWDNSNLNNLNGLENLSASWLLIKNNPSLTDISSLSIGGSYIKFELNGTPEILLPTIAANCDECIISIENSGITNLNGFQNVQTLKSLKLENVPSLNDISALSNATIFGELKIKNAPQLTDISVLSNFNSINILELNNLPLTSNFNPLSNITIEDITLHNLPLLNDFTFFNNTTSLNKLQLSSLNQINSLPTLNNITSLYGLYLFNLPSITSINGLENLTKIEELAINNLDGITTLEGLNNLNSSSGNTDRALIDINGNLQLTDFCAITTYVQNTTCYEIYIEPSMYSEYQVNDNAYNPTEPQVESPTECSL